MKSVCIDNKFQGRVYNITIGNIYDTYENKYDNWARVNSDTGYLMSVPYSFFITLDEWREKQINEIINEL